MKFNVSKNIAIAVSAIIICLGIVTFSYAKNNFSQKAQDNKSEGQAAEAAQLDTMAGGDSKPYLATQVNGETSGEKIILRWNPVDHPKFSGYKLVISKNNPNPRYPDDGYLYFITDKDTSSAIIDNSEVYKNGDFGEKLTPGEKYYFSITVLYADKAVPGDSLQLTYPANAVAAEAVSSPSTQPAGQTQTPLPKPSTPQPTSSLTAPQVTAYPDGNRIIVNWNRIDSANLQGYKVVISKNDNNPAYPKNGYLAWITNKNTTQWVIDNSSKYNGGDFGGYLTPGQGYYISVTAVYSDSKVPGNAVLVTYPSGGNNPGGQTSLDPVAISAAPSGSNLILSWPASQASNFEGYKVVISKSNPNPKYPDDGYLRWITDRNSTSLTVNSNTYYEGDIHGKLIPGESYYFSISIIYDGWVIVPGPAQYVKIPGAN
jgi:cell division septation protein DedD